MSTPADLRPEQIMRHRPPALLFGTVDVGRPLRSGRVAVSPGARP